MCKKAIAYYRVSTDKQGLRGLGMAAQETAVLNYVVIDGYEVVGTYTEVESAGRRKRIRPQMIEALRACKQLGATLIIAKLDRLSRDVGFIDALIKGDVPFICADMPHANKVMLQMHAVFAEWERDRISVRTKEGMAEAKKRGIVMGNPVKSAVADKRALDLVERIADARACGARSARDIGAMIGLHTTQVQRVLKRLRALGKE